MQSLRQYNKSRNYFSGFSLLELLIVVGILAIISSTSIQYFGNTEQEKREDLTRIELAELGKSIRQLHKDTGFWPQHDVDSDDIDLIPVHEDPYNWEVLVTNVDRNDYNNNSDTEDAMLNAWNPVSERGWRGPYTHRVLDSHVILGGDYLDIDGSDSGDSTDYNNPTCDDSEPSPCPEPIVLLDPYRNPYTLLNINNRNVIISSGLNGVFDELPITGTDEERYTTLCGEILSDDIAICP